MMKRIKGYFVLLVAVLLAVVINSCAPTIYGARKHRKDRNCGCENYSPHQTNLAYILENNSGNER